MERPESWSTHLSREIRSPLEAAAAHADLLLSTQLTDEQRARLFALSDAVSRAREGMMELVDMECIRGEGIGLDHQPFDLRSVLQEAPPLGTRLAVAPGVPARVVADPGRLRQILSTWGKQAASLASGKCLLLRVRGSELSLHFEFIAVEPLFEEEPIVCAAPSDAARTAAAYLIERMGGSLESREENALPLSFRLRLEILPEVRPHGGPQRLLGRRILLVDEDPERLRQVMRPMAASGGICGEAWSGPEAVAMLREASREGQPWEAVVVDDLLRGMDVWEFVAAVRRHPEIQDTRLILLASISWRGLGRAAREAGFHAFLPRPASPDEISMATSAALAPAPEGLITRHSLAEAHMLTAPWVLVVEDDPVNLGIAERRLAVLGCKVDTATDGVEALQTLASRSYDLVLMDCRMPRKDGWETTQDWRIQEQASGKNPVAIWAYTSAPFEADHVRSLESGMNGILLKPLRPGQLEAVLQKVRPDWTPPEAPVKKR